jgi:Domain of unknown function (DUF3576)
MSRYFPVSCIAFTLLLAACNSEPKADYPIDQEHRRVESRGKLTGDGLTIGGNDEEHESNTSPIGVNSFLWRATLDTVAFLPLTSADPFGGVILTDWHEEPSAPGERFKLNILILDKQLRSDALKVTAFRQIRDPKTGMWKDTETNPDTARQIEDSILTRAREMRVKQGTK